MLTDVTKADMVQDTIDRVIGLLGKIDVMVYASGVHLKKGAEDISEQEWDSVMDVNLKGAFITNKLVGQHMLDRGDGNIINIGSLGSQVALSKTLPYCVSKAGIEMLTKCLSSEWSVRGVRVNCILPGVFLTDLNKKALSDK